MKSNPIQFKDTRRSLWRSFNFCVLPVLMLVAWAGCRQETKVADINPVGDYALVSVNGNKVPFLLEHEGQKVTIKSGAFIINADGTCSSKMNFSLPSGGDNTRDVGATYTRQGTNLTMRWQGAGMTTGTLQGNTFTMQNEDMVLSYSK